MDKKQREIENEMKAAKATNNVSPAELKQYFDKKVVANFFKTKEQNPHLKKKEICALIGVSDSYLKRLFKDLNVSSPYRHKIPTNAKKHKKGQSLLLLNSAIEKMNIEKVAYEKLQNEMKTNPTSAFIKENLEKTKQKLADYEKYIQAMELKHKSEQEIILKRAAEKQAIVEGKNA